MNPDQLDIFTQPVIDIYRTLEEEIFLMMAKRLKTDDDITREQAFEWQAEKIQQLNSINDETIKMLSKTTGLAEKEIRKIFEEVGDETINTVDEDVERIYNQAKAEGKSDILATFVVLGAMIYGFQRLRKSREYKRTVREFQNRVFRDFNVFINETLITTNYGEGTVARMYRRIVEEAVSRVLTGDITINKAVAETVIKWAERGIQSGFVDRGGRIWSLDRYAEATIRSTVNTLYNELTINRMKEYGTDLVLVSSLPDPREACSHIQGKVASLSYPSSNPKYPSVYEFGYGEPWGLRGVNCRHRFYAWFEGISENNQVQYNVREAQERYQLSQKQRYYERQIRKAKRSLNIAKELGDEELIQRYRRLVRARQARIREFIKEHDLPRRYDRERVIA